MLILAGVNPLFWCANTTEVSVIPKELRVNDRIRSRKVRLIDQDGEQVGIVDRDSALQQAYDNGLDLVEVAPGANPTVCRIMDYGKYKYEQAKKEREARKNAKSISVKELKMRPKIDDHDFEVKLKHARRFLGDGDKVKCTIMFRGREIVHSDLGRELLERFANELEELGKIESRPNLEGRNMIMMIAPKE